MGDELKIAHIAATRNSESSAAWRILSAQRRVGMNAEALVHVNSKNVPNTKTFLEHSNGRRYLAAARFNAGIRKLTSPNMNNLPWSYSFLAAGNFKDLLNHDADIFNIHWIPSVLELSNLQVLKKPLVITLHDVWPLTGGCHCNLDCDNWENGCFKCPQNSHLEIFGLSAAHNWAKKEKYFQAIENLSIVAPSNWMADMVQRSPLFRNRRISTIPNCVDKGVFFLQDKITAKKEIGISKSKYSLLFVVSGDIKQHHKGIDLLQKVLNDKLINKERFELIIVGDNHKSNLDFQGFATRYLGIIDSQEKMNKIYNAADLIISTSRQDNLPNTLIEASFCGLPIISFNIGGISDIINHGENGRLIPAYDTAAMARAIVEMSYTRTIKSEVSRKAIRDFDFDKCAKSYEKHYLEISST